MSENKYTAVDLKEMQAWSLERKIQVTHPKIWDYVMRPKGQGGLGMREPLEYIGVKVESDQMTLEDIL